MIRPENKKYKYTTHKKQTQFTIHFHFPNKATLDNVISVKNVYFSLVIRFSAKYLHSIFLISSKHITIESEMALHLHLHFQQRDMKLIKTFCNSEYVSTSRKCSTIFVFIIIYILFIFHHVVATVNIFGGIAVTMVIITVNLSEMGEWMSVVGCSQRSRASGSFSSVKLLITEKKNLFRFILG